MNKVSQIALYRTTCNRSAKHKCVIYVAANKDWTARQRERNGNKGLPLAVAEHTPELDEAERHRHRAMSWQYNGIEPATLKGLEEDLRQFKFDEATIKRFVEAARPCF